MACFGSRSIAGGHTAGDPVIELLQVVILIGGALICTIQVGGGLAPACGIANGGAYVWARAPVESFGIVLVLSDLLGVAHDRMRSIG